MLSLIFVPVLITLHSVIDCCLDVKANEVELFALDIGIYAAMKCVQDADMDWANTKPAQV